MQDLKTEKLEKTKKEKERLSRLQKEEGDKSCIIVINMRPRYFVFTHKQTMFSLDLRQKLDEARKLTEELETEKKRIDLIPNTDPEYLRLVTL